MKRVLLYTDGACSGNPGPGGWGAILIYGEIKKNFPEEKLPRRTIVWNLPPSLKG